MRWIINYAKQRSEKTMVQKLAGELQDAAQNRGGQPSRNVKILIEWPRPTRLSRIIDGSNCETEGQCYHKEGY